MSSITADPGTMGAIEPPVARAVRRESWAIGGVCGILAVAVAVAFCCCYWQSVDTRLSGLEKDVAVVKGQLTAIDTRLASMEAALSVVAQRPVQQQQQNVHVERELTDADRIQQLARERHIAKGILTDGKPVQSTE